MRFSLWNKIVTALGGGLVALLFIGGAGCWSTTQLSKTYLGVDHSRQVLQELERFQVNILNAETASRGYALNRDEQFLISRNSIEQAIYHSLEEVKKQFSGNSDQTKRLTQLEPQVLNVFTLMRQADALAGKGQTGAAHENDEQIKASVELIRHAIVQMEDEERLFLQKSSTNSQKLIDQARIFISLTLGCGLIFIGTMIYYVRRDLIERRHARLSLRDVNDQVLDLYNNAPCGYHSLDSEGVFTAINDTELKWLGYTREQVIGKLRMSDVLTPASLSLFVSHFEQLKRAGDAPAIEFDLVVKDGGTLAVAASATAVYDAAGNFVSSRSTLHDISDRKQAEQITQQLNTELEQKVQERTSELQDANGLLRREVDERKRLEQAAREAEEFSRQIITGAQEGIAVFDLNLRFQVFNPFLETLTTWKAQDVIGKTIEEIMPTSFAEDVTHRLRLALNGEVAYSGDQFTPASSLAPARWVSTKESPLHNAKGEIIGVISIVNDISARKQAESAIREAADFMKQIIVGIEEGIAVVDRDFKYQAFNPFMEKMTGWKAADVIGKHVTTYMTPEQATESIGFLKRVLKGEVIYQGDRALAATEDRPELWINSRITPLHNSKGEIVGTIGTANDVTERRHAEAQITELNASLEQRIKERTQELDAKTKELESFCYSVSHDLKAPLRGIDGYSRLLQEDFSERLNDDGRKFLSNVRSATLQMTDLIDDLLTYSRQERRVQLATRIDLLDLVTEQIRQREMDLKTIQLDIKVERINVLADYEGMTVAFRNLLDNAIKFSSRSDHPRIMICSAITEHHCVLSVQDNGTGFDMRFYDKIFEIFQRLHRAEDYPGTGIGLALVRKAMERMGGRVWAESESGQGASFYLEIPLFNQTDHAGTTRSTTTRSPGGTN